MRLVSPAFDLEEGGDNQDSGVGGTERSRRMIPADRRKAIIHR